MSTEVKHVIHEGQRFGHLTVTETDIEYGHWRRSRNAYAHERAVRVKCDCGREYFALVKNLVGARGISSCRECKNRVVDTRKALAIAHANIVKKCYSSSSPQYRWYGARGITLHEEWRDREAFVQDVHEQLGDRPEGFSLDRIDNDGDYAPGNLRWASTATQHENKRQGHGQGNRTNHPRKVKAVL